MGVVNFTPRLLYPRRNSPLYPLYNKLGVPQGLSGRYEEENKFAPAGNRTAVDQSVAIPTELSRPPTKFIIIIVMQFFSRGELSLCTGMYLWENCLCDSNATGKEL
jgi:hypothetical protein